MLTTLSILSRTQGNLNAKPLTEDQYFAQFVSPQPHETPRSPSAILRLLSLVWRKANVVKQA